ncbi:MAG: FecR domain-containing protein [Chloroflexi bacterium]|nr:FecR domain-containing protein [Chloroflexota bacterium]
MPRWAKLSDLRNTVEAQDKPGADWQAAVEGQDVHAGGGVKTGEEARARLNISDGTIIRLAASTVFSLTELSPEPKNAVTRLQLGAGKMWLSVSKALGLGSFEVDTPVGVAAVRGSLMSTEFFPSDGRMIVTCLEGQCRLTGKTGSGKFADLTAGQQTGIPGYGKDPGGIITINSVQLGDWANEFPEAHSLVVTITPGPPPTMTPTAAPATPGGGGAASGGGQTACDNPYFPLRTGASWTYSTAGGPMTWKVTNMTGDANSAAGDMTAEFAGQTTLTWQWQCDATGIVSYQFGTLGITQLGQIASYKLVSHSGTFFPPANLLVPGYSWSNAYEIQMEVNIKGATSTMSGTISRSEEFTVTGADPVTVGGQTFDGIQISRSGSSDIQIQAPGVTAPATHTEDTGALVLARGIGIVQMTISAGEGVSDTQELTSYDVP